MPLVRSKQLDSGLAIDTLTRVRNETGATIPKGTLLVSLGLMPSGDRILVQAADKDNPTRRPAIGVAIDAIPNNTDAEALVTGTLRGVNTSAFSLSDQLVLGSNGAFSRPPPDLTPFTGEVQDVGSVTHVDAAVGEITIYIGGLLPATAYTVNRLRTVDEARTTYNADTAFQTKVSHNLSATLTPGTYEVEWECTLDASSTTNAVEARLQDVTDAVTLDGPVTMESKDVTDRVKIYGSQDVTLAGVAKAIEVQFRTTNTGTTVGIQQARVKSRRVD